MTLEVLFCFCSPVHSFGSPPIVRLRVGPPGPEAPRPHPQHPHPPEVVERVKAWIETTTLPHRVIAKRAGVDPGTVSRWKAAHGWQRPPGAAPSTPRPDRRYVPVIVGRVLAQRLRIQAERLICDLERAPTVDPAALAEAIALLERARAEQQVRRGKRAKRLMPPPPRPDAHLAAEAAKQAAKDKRRRSREDAALLGWKRRYSRRARHHAWMLEKIEE